MLSVQVTQKRSYLTSTPYNHTFSSASKKTGSPHSLVFEDFTFILRWNYADRSLNPSRAFFFSCFSFFQSTLLTPSRLKPATLHAWGVGQQFIYIGFNWKALMLNLVEQHMTFVLQGIDYPNWSKPSLRLHADNIQNYSQSSGLSQSSDLFQRESSWTSTCEWPQLSILFWNAKKNLVQDNFLKSGPNSFRNWFSSVKGKSFTVR